MLNKIKHILKTNWKDYKYHSLMMDSYFSKPKKWEQITGLFIIVLFILSFYYELQILQPIAFILLTIATGSQAYRGVKEGKKCYKEYVKVQILKGDKPYLIIRRSVGTFTAFLLKYGKPAFKVCAVCFSAGMSGVGFYHTTFGFNPLSEYVLVNSGKQTSEQAWNHIMNPSKYAQLDNAPAPYIQDLEEENLKKDNLIKEKDNLIKDLKKTLEDINKK